MAARAQPAMMPAIVFLIPVSLESVKRESSTEENHTGSPAKSQSGVSKGCPDNRETSEPAAPHSGHVQGAQAGLRLSMKAWTPSSATSSIMLQAMVRPASS